MAKYKCIDYNLLVDSSIYIYIYIYIYIDIQYREVCTSGSTNLDIKRRKVPRSFFVFI